MTEETRIRVTRKVLSARDRDYGVTSTLILTHDFSDGYQFDTFNDEALNALKRLDNFYFL